MRGFSNEAEQADPALIAGWLTARSIARQLPAPLAAHDGWVVETGTEIETRRYVFARLSDEIATLAHSIDCPGVFLKLCSDDDTLRMLLPAQWELAAPSWVMLGPDQGTERLLPAGYTPIVNRAAKAIELRIVTVEGELAASGYAAEAGGVFVYDRIVTHPAHQRRGLGSAMIALLGAERRSANSRQILVATAAGRALYETLGWSVHAPYASAFIPRQP